MTEANQKQLGNTLWSIADQLRGAMGADDFRDYMLSFLFLRYLSDNYEAAAKKELGRDYPAIPTGDPRVPLAIWYANNPGDVVEIPANVKHWHGAAPDSWFQHLAVEVPAEGASNEWLEFLPEEEYNKLP